jgi:hypothetical protein
MRIAIVKRNSAEATPVQLEDGPAGNARLAALRHEHGAGNVTVEGEAPAAPAAPAKQRARKKAAKK